MKIVLLFLALLILPSLHRCDVNSQSDFLFQNGMQEDTANHGGVSTETDLLISDLSEIFAEDDDRAMQLLKPGAHHDRLELNQMVLERLAAIEEPLSIVSVVGPYHGGKSFLLNVLLKSTQGFTVGAVPDIETRGIWIRVVSKKKLTGEDGSRIVLVDTEGFYGEDATRSYDARIFAMATLVSSHLIYNTLRTIGDAQSVSALADLAKQAQVFNLQNWLHSAEASSDQQQFSSPSNMDPFLLLKALDFPPLTWVVQGFDMDIHAHNPMEYLQKYLEAHAHNGDLTIDTLFTQGISCVTMRTPTDLNKLREEVGGVGLAAHAELYSYLHPGYLADAERLRTAVFGKLKAKGGFSGKTLAGVLPLLVHYVNEDFPLNAERKMRDVLMEIVVDGAFSGGVQYFQMLMQKRKFPPRARDMHGETVPANTEKNDLSLLVSTTYTAREFEDFMTVAENKAIEYCKQRCVGVPVARIDPTCITQLGTKIGRMKPSFRDENERRVKQVLMELGQDLRLSAVKEMEQLQLPMRDVDIQRSCKQSQNRVLQGYESLVGPHRGSNLYNEARAHIMSAIQTICDKVSLVNAEKIGSLLNDAKEAYQEAYENAIHTGILGLDGGYNDRQQHDGTNNQGKVPISPKKLLDVHKAAIKIAQEAFEKFVKAAGLPWVGPGDVHYDFHLYTNLQFSKKQYEKLQDENEKEILDYIAMRVGSLTLLFKEAVANITPFPENDEVLSDKIDQLAKKTLEEFSALVKDYTTVNGVDKKRSELTAQIQDMHAQLLKKNTALMAAFCYDPLQEAYRELRMQDCEMTYNNIFRTRAWWSRKCLWPGPRNTFGFKYAAFQAAQKHLNKAQAEPRKAGQAAGMVLSPSTRNKVIQSWVEHDLARFSTTVFVNFSTLSAIFVILLTTFLWLFGGPSWSRDSQNSPTREPPSSFLKPSPFKKDGAFYSRSPNRYQR